MLVVIPFRAGGKSRLPSEIRVDVALAMLGDVVEAAVEVGEARVVSDDPAGRLVAVELGAEASTTRARARARPWPPRSRASRGPASS